MNSYPYEDFDTRLSKQGNYRLDDISYNRLKADHIRFRQEYSENFSTPSNERRIKTNFITEIMSNYLSYISSSEERKEAFIDEFIDMKKNRTASKHTGKLYYNKDLKLALDAFINPQKTRSFLDGSMTEINSHILTKYTKELFWDREMIYYYPVYSKIETITKNSRKTNNLCRLTVINKITSEIEVYKLKPYKFDLDDTALSYYLVGYSMLEGSDDNYIMSSFKLGRIINIDVLNDTFEKSDDEQNEVYEYTLRFGMAYINDENTSEEPLKIDGQSTEKESSGLITVRLSQEGYDRYMKRINRKRPVPCEKPTEIKINNEVYYDLSFNCSENQALYYFFQFGENAKILAPDSLRETFRNEYRKALNNYPETEEE